MSLPIPIIVSNFEAFYNNQIRTEKAALRRTRLAQEKVFIFIFWNSTELKTNNQTTFGIMDKPWSCAL